MDFLHIFLTKSAPAPLYVQLYRALAAQITAGQLEAGGRLPGKRTAAGQLGVSVNTVNQAYQMLAAEGYVEAQPRSGFVVAALQPGIAAAPVPTPSAPKNSHSTPPQWRFSFSSGGIDISLFPTTTWNRLFREVLSAEPHLMERGDGAGDAALRGAIAGYLQGYRGVHCTADDLVIGAGLEVLVGRLARLYPRRLWACEDPGYPQTQQILGNMGVDVVPLPVDAAGLSPDALAASGAAVAHLTPSHQFPTGAVMPVGRRTELLAWAGAKAERFLLEDDYDSEFRFDGRPLPCLQGLDSAGRVVYAGTFSRSLAPGLRAAYLVLPAAIRADWLRMYGGYSCTVSRPEQHTLARFITGGHFARSLNRMRVAYRRRRELLEQELASQLHMPYRLLQAHTGLYLGLQLPGLDAPAAAATARDAGIYLRALDEYRATPAAASATRDVLVLGYGGIPDEKIAASVAALAAVLHESIRA